MAYNIFILVTDYKKGAKERTSRLRFFSLLNSFSPCELHHNLTDLCSLGAHRC